LAALLGLINVVKLASSGHPAPALLQVLLGALNSADEIKMQLSPSQALSGAGAWMVAIAGETYRDLAWTQLAQKLGVYNII
jgi:hypothetical protein